MLATCPAHLTLPHLSTNKNTYTSSAVIKNAWSCTSTRYVRLHGVTIKHISNLIFLRFDVLTAVKMSIVIFWVVTLYVNLENGGAMLLRNGVTVQKTTIDNLI
jgi:hypothetical protein